MFLILILMESTLNSTIKEDKQRTIFIIGDSTAANKEISGGKVERG